MRNYKYPLLNNKLWLYQKYVNEKLSTKKITKLVGAKTPNSVRQALIRHNIKVRTISDGLTVTRSDDFILDSEVIEGSLLGDGHMFTYNKHSDFSYPYFAKKNIGYDHILFVAKFLFPNTAKDRIKIENGINPFNGNPITYYKISSLVRKELKPYYKRWYPKSTGFKKIVPRDLKMTKNVLLNWFMDDGCTIYVNNKKSIDCKFCAMGFTRQDQEFLIDLVIKKFNLKLTIRKAESGSKSDIYAPSSQVKKLLDIIGPCPVPSMEYKWKKIIKL